MAEETARREPQLAGVGALAEELKEVLRGQGGPVDDKLSLLRSNWIAVTSRAEEWLKLLLVRRRTHTRTQTHTEDSPSHHLPRPLGGA